jgi:hypothetical protein
VADQHAIDQERNAAAQLIEWPPVKCVFTSPSDTQIGGTSPIFRYCLNTQAARLTAAAST